MEQHARKADGRRGYSPQFKREQLARVGRGELTLAELSRELGISRSLLQRWKHLAQQATETAVDTRPNVGFGRPLHSLDRASPDAPLPDSIRSDVVLLLARLGKSDANDSVRTIAAYLAKRMRAHLY